MDRDNLRRVLEVLKERGIIKGPIKPSGSEYFGISCIFAQWRHERGRDRKASMTVKISHTGASIFFCHSCRYRRSLTEGVNELNIFHNGTLTDLTTFIRENDGKVTFDFKPKEDQIEVTDYSEELVKIIKTPFSSQAIEFLKTKGCSLKTARRFLCAWVKEAERQNYEGQTYFIKDAIVFPIIKLDKDGSRVCAGAQSRELNAPEWKSKYGTFFSFPARHYLFGEHLLPKADNQRLFIMEGPLDVMHFNELEEHAVGALGLFLGKPKISKIKKANPSCVFIVPDQDSPGRYAADSMCKKLNAENVPTKIVDVKKDPKQVTKEDIRRIFYRRRK